MGWGAPGWLAGAALRELALFAAAGFLIGGLDELAIDLIWAARALWRRLAVYSRFPRAHLASLPLPAAPGRIVVFIPAWDEADVIGHMLATALARFGAGDYRLYVGCYPNDPATIAAVRAIADPRVRAVVGARPGPTTKADCLNSLWTALLADEAADGVSAKAIVLHDAEDVVDAGELVVFDRMIERFDLVQLPVLPLVQEAGGRFGRLISGHYCDEFAEAHGKLVVVREALGAAIPSAGVGCAIARAALARIADAAGGAPFDAASLTEDYELGLRIAGGGRGGRGGAFVRLPAGADGGLVAVRAYFPHELGAAVRQKARWMTGIALAGWDRLGWEGGLAERWMRLRDRRALLAALVLGAGYAALLLWGVLGLLALLGLAPTPRPGLPAALILANVGLALWRLAVRAGFVAAAYGWRAALCVPARTITGNIIATMAARRALAQYLGLLRGATLRWDKTAHHFPATGIEA